MSARAAGATPRSADLRLVGLHVRAGNYALARAELENLAGADRLDAGGILDLAEVRWRTGDLAGAAAAAAAWLEAAPTEPAPGAVLANAICAEAAASRGDTEAASTFVEAAANGLGDGRALAALLAGIPARADWPWPAEIEPPAPAGPAEDGFGPAGAAAEGAAAPAGASGTGPEPMSRAIPLAAAAADLVRSGASLLGEAPERAAVLLALALRADRAAAEAVLDALDAATPAGTAGGSIAAADTGAGAAALAFVRAEALRAAGRNDEARIAYASAERLATTPAEAGPPGSSQ